MNPTIAVAFTGASGLPYGMRLVECLIAAGVKVQLLYSPAAQVVAKQEMGFTLPSRPAEVETDFTARFNAAPGQLNVYGQQEWFAPLASGSLCHLPLHHGHAGKGGGGHGRRFDFAGCRCCA